MDGSMPNMRLRAAAVASLPLFALLISCGGEAGRRDRQADGSLALSSSDSVSVLVQLSGLMLIVPPARSGGETQVFLPKVAEAHGARLAFGARPMAACEEYDRTREICFVDLKEWTVEGLGAGGSPTDLRTFRFPRGVVNVTEAIGNGYRIDPVEAAASIHTRVALRAGQPATSACRLAQWHYRPAGLSRAQSDTISLVNRLDWSFLYPSGSPFVLTLRNRADTSRIARVRLYPVRGRIAVLLAHVPVYELRAIVADQKITPPLPSELRHLHDYFDLLRRPGGKTPPPDSLRRVPNRPAPAGPVSTSAAGRECSIAITVGTSDRKSEQSIAAVLGPKTYACVVGTGST
jgi:hypothetical protein